MDGPSHHGQLRKFLAVLVLLLTVGRPSGRGVPLSHNLITRYGFPPNTALSFLSVLIFQFLGVSLSPNKFPSVGVINDLSNKSYFQVCGFGIGGGG